MLNWGNFLTYAIITAATPGPNNIMSMTSASKFGLRKSFAFNLGIWGGLSLVMLTCAMLGTSLHTVLPTIKMPMLIMGAFYILYLAWKTYKSSVAEIEENQAKNSFLSGLSLQFINPKIYIYGIVSLEAYILPAYQGNTMALFGFALLLSTIGFIFTLLWAMFGSLFRALFSKHANTTNGIMALLLVYCAISLFR
ncbi:MAG: LysE family transporter [Firmicutes bacterium]|nr:LysE family transporter [Bacillota bacterium]